MHVQWDPEDGSEKQTWQFDPDDVLRRDAQLIEKHFGGSYDQWCAQLQMGQIQARAVLLWYMLKLVHPKLRFEDVPDFRVRQLQVQMGSAEIKALFNKVKRMKLEPDQREAFESQILADTEDALDREGVTAGVAIIDGNLVVTECGEAKEDLPKALSPASD